MYFHFQSHLPYPRRQLHKDLEGTGLKMTEYWAPEI